MDYMRYILGISGALFFVLAIYYFTIHNRRDHIPASVETAQKTSPGGQNSMPAANTALQKDFVKEPSAKASIGEADQQKSMRKNGDVDKPQRLQGAERLVAAYPEHLATVEGNAIRWKDGTLMPYDDGVRTKTIDQLFNTPSLYDQMAMPYTKGAEFPRKRGWDPGRVRYEPFFRKMYGGSEKQVRSKLTWVQWLPQTMNIAVRVTSVNGVHKKLEAISQEIEKLPQELQQYVSHAETFNWRPIAGTRRLSTHSFGIAIDFNTDRAEYWLKDNPHRKGNFAPMHSMPREIIAVFEKHGFIWGGKWYHYDTMHFEYRPELL